jgi:hypothetical protein
MKQRIQGKPKYRAVQPPPPECISIGVRNRQKEIGIVGFDERQLYWSLSWSNLQLNESASPSKEVLIL